METKHTPTPWYLNTCQKDSDAPIHYEIVNNEETGEIVYAEVYDEADAAFIVKAVNCHDELVELLTDIRNHLQTGAALHSGSLIFREDNEAIHVLNDALAKARGVA